jgi:dihydroorotate dehydrogenase
MGALDAGYRMLARPVLFRLGHGDAETAHHRTLRWLAVAGTHPSVLTSLRRMLARDRSPRTVFGIDFPSAVGLAAGVDKDGLALKAWPALGFGFVELGTVTARPQPGNPRPRLFRLRDSEAVINRMGFNNHGSAALARRLAAAGPVGIPIGVSLGKSKLTPLADSVGDYRASLEAVHPHADYLAVNVSSPNTPGLRGLQDRGPLSELVGALTDRAAALAADTGRARPVPVLVKIAPDLSDSAIGDVLQVCADTGAAGVIAGNTTLARTGLAPADVLSGAEPGGLSGAPLRARALQVVRFVRAHTELPIIGVGGIFGADDGVAMLDAGADLLQVYTGFIYRGPALVGELNAAIARRTGSGPVRPGGSSGTMGS